MLSILDTDLYSHIPQTLHFYYIQYCNNWIVTETVKIPFSSAYHGHSTVLIDISPYKFKALGDEGKKDYVHVVPSPDTYNGKYQGDPNDPELGAKYAEEVKQAIASMHKNRRNVSTNYEFFIIHFCNICLFMCYYH